MDNHTGIGAPCQPAGVDTGVFYCLLCGAWVIGERFTSDWVSCWLCCGCGRAPGLRCLAPLDPVLLPVATSVGSFLVSARRLRNA